MNRFALVIGPISLAIAGGLCGSLLPPQDLVWAEWVLAAAGLAVGFWAAYPKKKTRA